MNQDWCTVIKIHNLFIFLILHLISFFYSRIPTKIPHYIWPVYPLGLVWSVSFWDYPCFDNLISIEEYWLDIFQNNHQRDLSEVFLMTRLRWYVFERKTTEVKCHFHFTISKKHAINVIYHCWYWMESHHWGGIWDFSNVKWNWCCICLYFWERKSYADNIIRSEVIFYFLEDKEPS